MVAWEHDPDRRHYRGDLGVTPISQNTKVTITLVLALVPVIVWGAKLDSEVSQLKLERQQIREELREIRKIVEDINIRVIRMAARQGPA